MLDILTAFPYIQHVEYAIALPGYEPLQYVSLEQAYSSSKLIPRESLPTRALYTYRGHSAPVKAVAWSPDGQRIASAGEDGTVQVWNATTGCNVLTYPGHRGMVNTVAWSPRGKYIASAGQDKTVQVWKATMGETLFTHTGHLSSVTALAWSPDEQRIASASQDRTVQAWNKGSKTTYAGEYRPLAPPVNWSLFFALCFETCCILSLRRRSHCPRTFKPGVEYG